MCYFRAVNCELHLTFSTFNLDFAKSYSLQVKELLHSLTMLELFIHTPAFFCVISNPGKICQQMV